MKIPHKTRARTTLHGPALLLLVACGSAGSPEPAGSAEGAAADPTRFRVPHTAAREIRTQAAGAAELVREIVLPGTLRVDAGRRAVVVARLAGEVEELLARPGDRVQVGDLLAVLHSRELGDARRAYLDALHGLDFAAAALEREERLWERRITPEETWLRARQEHGLARLEVASRVQALRTLGADPAELEALRAGLGAEDGDAPDLTRLERRCPLSGQVVARPAVLGAGVHEDDVLYEVVDLSVVQVELRVRAADLAELEVGDELVVHSADLGRSVQVPLLRIDPRVDPDTQTVLALAEVPSPDGAWRPGLFVRVVARTSREQVDVAVPLTCLHEELTPAGEPQRAHVFVRDGEAGWEAREVRLGRRDGSRVEVLEGLAAGEEVAVSDGTLLEAAWLGQGGLEE